MKNCHWVLSEALQIEVSSSYYAENKDEIKNLFLGRFGQQNFKVKRFVSVEKEHKDKKSTTYTIDKQLTLTGAEILSFIDEKWDKYWEHHRYFVNAREWNGVLKKRFIEEDPENLLIERDYSEDLLLTSTDNCQQGFFKSKGLPLEILRCSMGQKQFWLVVGGMFRGYFTVVKIITNFIGMIFKSLHLSYLQKFQVCQQ